MYIKNYVCILIDRDLHILIDVLFNLYMIDNLNEIFGQFYFV